MFPLLLLLVFCENIIQCKHISSINITFVAFMNIYFYVWTL